MASFARSCRSSAEFEDPIRKQEPHRVETVLKRLNPATFELPILGAR
ncbi:MAG: hypothetical protein IPK83_21725 [Planctomycetes bacterium]|nr:hypothetical protein [Planctomycetota bacterium]